MDENTTHIIRVLLGTATDVERDSSDLCHEGVVLCFVAFLDDGRKHQGGIHEIITNLDVMNLVCSLLENDQTSFVEALQPRLPRPISHCHRHDVSDHQH